ncbi:deoxyribonuclease IV [Aquifex aeolicus]|uniref:Probable endonuclease 4 n=1 Tax=Aquifex aeolicus (strain VF5) TaxID=224324 RepID=END4_AQUAE|nr:deoxyribonuclease IV [Aquifex aeolicus]O67551.1 RecName: Full=Probable endonuclease 4; AltName: Full=Endodeoxyribonuclease IV; AltName: Full=Endonuclease IV [Aquifex aeolicus VF5]AAC07514.1 deoxyribonuclease IV [Aquifex aeolicus VF5]
MALFGAHVSSAGSILKTFKRAKDIGAEVFQFFLRSPRAWYWKGVDKETKQAFIEKLKDFKNPVMVHAPYLLNLASPNEELREKSVKVFLEELKFCDEVGIHFYNFHPGTAKGISDEEGLRNVIKSLEEVFSEYTPKFTTVLLENTAGERGDLGKNFKELKEIMNVFRGIKLGVCLDTCHAFAYGYEINTKEGFENFKREIEKMVGLESVKAVHANDSKVPLGGRKDRHEHIGKGYIGLEGFKNLLKDEYFSTLPYYIETPKENNMDPVNLSVLREIYQNNDL